MSYRYDDVELIFDKIKARVKSTGDIFVVSDTTTIYPEHYDKSYNITEVEFLDVKENSFPKDEPDYWTRLERQAAIAAMGGMCGNTSYDETAWEDMAEDAIRAAHALVEKLKELEEK